MSVWSATTYTSAAPSTSPTSMSRRSSSACISPDSRALENHRSPTPYILNPTLFGFEFTVACGVTGFPQWLDRLSKIDQGSVAARASTDKATGSPSLAEKCGVVAIGVIFARWLVRSACENVVTLVIFGGLLWLVFGGYQGLEQQEQLRQPPSSTGHEAIWATDSHSKGSPVVIILPPVEATPLVQETGHQDSDVPPWSPSCRDVFTTSNCTLPTLESEEDSLYVVDIGTNVIKTTPTKAKDTVSENLFDPSVALLEDANKLQGSKSEFNTAEPNSQVPTDEDAQEIFLNKDQLEQLQYWHGYPEFNDTNQNGPGGRLYEQYIANQCDPFFPPDDGKVYEHVDVYPGRPLEADEKDLVFLLGALYPLLPEYLKNAINARPMEDMVKMRAKNGENFLVQELEKQWLIICPGTVVAAGAPIATLQDVVNIIAMNRKKFTPASLFDDRRYIGLDNPYRPYLLEAEEKMINEGIIDYNDRNEGIEFEQSIICKATKDSPEHAQFKSYDRVPAWIYKTDQNGLLDPNAFHGCECGKAAVAALGSYRDEKEHNYKEMKGFESLFPIEVLNGDELEDAMADLVWYPHLPERTALSCSQKILQMCELHHTDTDNIFVLVDTSAKDIDGRIGDS